jgi:hypothetical protein
MVFGATAYDIAANGFEDLQFHRDLASDPAAQSSAKNAGGELRDQAATVLRGWSDKLPPEPVEPKY